MMGRRAKGGGRLPRGLGKVKMEECEGLDVVDGSPFRQRDILSAANDGELKSHGQYHSSTPTAAKA